MKRIFFAVILAIGVLAVRQSMASDPIMGIYSSPPIMDKYYSPPIMGRTVLAITSSPLIMPAIDPNDERDQWNEGGDLEYLTVSAKKSFQH